MMYATGRGVPKDMAEADRWRQKLGEQAQRLAEQAQLALQGAVPRVPTGEGCQKKP
jgi:TPR repeat protein